MIDVWPTMGLLALSGIVIFGIIPWAFKKIITSFYTTKYAIYFNQKLVYNSIAEKMKSGQSLADIITTNQREIKNGKS